MGVFLYEFNSYCITRLRVVEGYDRCWKFKLTTPSIITHKHDLMPQDIAPAKYVSPDFLKVGRMFAIIHRMEIALNLDIDPYMCSIQSF